MSAHGSLLQKHFYNAVGMYDKSALGKDNELSAALWEYGRWAAPRARAALTVYSQTDPSRTERGYSAVLAAVPSDAIAHSVAYCVAVAL